METLKPDFYDERFNDWVIYGWMSGSEAEEPRNSSWIMNKGMFSDQDNERDPEFKRDRLQSGILW